MLSSSSITHKRISLMFASSLTCWWNKLVFSSAAIITVTSANRLFLFLVRDNSLSCTLENRLNDNWVLIDLQRQTETHVQVPNSFTTTIERRLEKRFVLLSNERIPLGSPEIPPGYKSEHCDTGGKYPFPNRPHFCTCDCAHVPVEQRVSIKSSCDRYIQSCWSTIY